MGSLVRDIPLAPAVFSFQEKDFFHETTLNVWRFNFNILSFDETKFELKICKGVSWMQLIEKIGEISWGIVFVLWH